VQKMLLGGNGLNGGIAYQNGNWGGRAASRGQATGGGPAIGKGENGRSGKLLVTTMLESKFGFAQGGKKTAFRGHWGPGGKQPRMKGRINANGGSPAEAKEGYPLWGKKGKKRTCWEGGGPVRLIKKALFLRKKKSEKKGGKGERILRERKVCRGKKGGGRGNMVR